MQLFRDEAATAGAAQWLGTVRLHRSLAANTIALIAAGLSGLLISFTLWGEVQHKSHLTGVLVPSLGALAVTAPQAGQISRLQVVEGSRVQAGDVLFAIDSERLGIAGGQVRDKTSRVQQQIAGRLDSLRAEREQRVRQTRQREEVLRSRIRNLESTLDEARQELVIQERRVELAQSSHARIERLARDGFVADAQAQAKLEDVLDAEAKTKTLKRSRLSMEGDLEALRGQLTDVRTSFNTDIQQLERAAALAEQEAIENASARSLVVTAQFDGTVTALEYRTGQSVQQGQAVLTLVPSGPDSRLHLEAHLFAPSHAIGFVAPGQRVFLRYPAYPFEKFGVYPGTVSAVSSSPFSGLDLPANVNQQLASRSGPQEPVYRVVVNLESQNVTAYGQAIPLKTGMSVDADAIARRQKIWEWLLAPVLATRRSLLTFGIGAD